MEEVREAIGIDKVDMSGNLIFIEEEHKSDANFVLHAITSHCINKNHVACFVLFHNTFGHFHNVGMKLGYNLKKACDSHVKVIEPLRILSKNVQKQNNELGNESLEFNVKSGGSDLAKQIVQVIRDECATIQKLNSQKVYIIVDDLSHLFDLGLNIQDIWLFIRHLRSMGNDEPHLTLCIASHVYKAAPDLCEPNIIALGLRHFAELVINVQPLETGFSRNVSGKMIICWKAHQERQKFKWPEEMVYLFKLSDRHVKLFAPGSSHVIS